MNFTHLVLLIGTNPLPNLVVAKWFLHKNENLKVITAIHSNKTYDIARRLEKALKKGNQHENLEFRFLGLTAAGDGVAIQRDLERSFSFDPGHKLHLNYTGGTKNMAVHAYRFLGSRAGENISFSYLNAGDFELKFDDGSPPIKNLRDEKAVRMTINDMLTLHDCRQYEETENGGEYVDWSAANAFLQDLIEAGRIRDFVNWKNDKIRKFFYDDRDRLRKPDDVSLAELQVADRNRTRGMAGQTHPFHEQAMQLVQTAFPEKQKWIFDEKGRLAIPDSRRDYKNKKGDFVQGILYLDGLWLEQYVTQVISDRISEEGLEFRHYPNWRVLKGAAQKDFEIDLMIIYGYQLCGISMTTAWREALCKSKGFEIMHRCEQMGGEEARSILITTLDDEKVQKIEDDLVLEVGGHKPFLVLGAKDLPADTLWKNVKKHILDIRKEI